MASAIAVGECQLLCLRRETFLARLHASPLLNQWTIQLLSDRARHMTDFVERLGFWLHQIVVGDYQPVIAALAHVQNQEGDRALIAAAASFQAAIDAIRAREERLRRELRELRLEVDEDARQQEVNQIAQADYFQSLLQFSQQYRRDLLSERRD
ncbi:MAG: hypothetical protein HC838_05885 [Spirulinaceae cyanobacterium RM2_2_10]|nr:hypothetical protein [Spirulinaceae cyanobacterium RM2_2_10]